MPRTSEAALNARLAEVLRRKQLAALAALRRDGVDLAVPSGELDAGGGAGERRPGAGVAGLLGGSTARERLARQAYMGGHLHYPIAAPGRVDDCGRPIGRSGRCAAWGRASGANHWVLSHDCANGGCRVDDGL